RVRLDRRARRSLLAHDEPGRPIAGVARRGPAARAGRSLRARGSLSDAHSPRALAPADSPPGGHAPGRGGLVPPRRPGSLARALPLSRRARGRLGAPTVGRIPRPRLEPQDGASVLRLLRTGDRAALGRLRPAAVPGRRLSPGRDGTAPAGPRPMTCLLVRLGIPVGP